MVVLAVWSLWTHLAGLKTNCIHVLATRRQRTHCKWNTFFYEPQLHTSLKSYCYYWWMATWEDNSSSEILEVLGLCHQRQFPSLYSKKWMTAAEWSQCRDSQESQTAYFAGWHSRHSHNNRNWLVKALLVFPLCCTVPSSVTGVTVNNSGRSDYLSVSWLPASGDVDSYLVTLSHDDQIVQTLTISKSFSECSFSSLTPGTLYNVMITTKSGKYENYSFSQERTGKESLWVNLVAVTTLYSHYQWSINIWPNWDGWVGLGGSNHKIYRLSLSLMPQLLLYVIQNYFSMHKSHTSILVSEQKSCISFDSNTFSCPLPLYLAFEVYSANRPPQKLLKHWKNRIGTNY